MSSLAGTLHGRIKRRVSMLMPLEISKNKVNICVVGVSSFSSRKTVSGSPGSRTRGDQGGYSRVAHGPSFVQVLYRFLCIRNEKLEI